jgi:phosphate uptake regulator
VLDDFKEDVSQALFVLYYLGTENLFISSRKEVTLEAKATIKHALKYMAGTEIVAEDKHKIHIKVLLDKSKVEVDQLFYRVGLLISTSIDSLLASSAEEIKDSEEEVDRLYHLISKILLLTHTNAEILLSSRIENVHYIVSYQLIAKKMENIEDCLYKISLIEGLKKGKEMEKPLRFIQEKTMNGMTFLLNRNKKPFSRTPRAIVQAMEKDISRLGNIEVVKYLDDMLRFAVDIEEELTQISFMTMLIREKVL